MGLFHFQMAFSWLINGGDPNYLLTGMILQVWVVLNVSAPFPYAFSFPHVEPSHLFKVAKGR